MNTCVDSNKMYTVNASHVFLSYYYEPECTGGEMYHLTNSLDKCNNLGARSSYSIVDFEIPANLTGHWRTEVWRKSCQDSNSTTLFRKIEVGCRSSYTPLSCNSTTYTQQTHSIRCKSDGPIVAGQLNQCSNYSHVGKFDECLMLPDSPTEEPTTTPTYTPSDKPTDKPTDEPTDKPTEPTDEPTEPIDTPTDEPTEPIYIPTDEPTEPTNPPLEPTFNPTNNPNDPTNIPPTNIPPINIPPTNIPPTNNPYQSSDSSNADNEQSIASCTFPTGLLVLFALSILLY